MKARLQKCRPKDLKRLVSRAPAEGMGITEDMAGVDADTIRLASKLIRGKKWLELRIGEACQTIEELRPKQS